MGEVVPIFQADEDQSTEDRLREGVKCRLYLGADFCKAQAEHWRMIASLARAAGQSKTARACDANAAALARVAGMSLFAALVARVRGLR